MCRGDLELRVDIAFFSLLSYNTVIQSDGFEVNLGK
jgi:hypothetical protein